METDPSGPDPAPDPVPADVLPWPPPGLARIQGDAWGVARRLTFGGLILVLPLFLTMAARDPFDLGGALGDAWWIAALTTVIALFLLVLAFRDIGRLLARGTAAMSAGHGGWTVCLTAADRARDMGFLLQGARHFGELGPAARRGLAVSRVAAAGAALLGSLWIPLGFSLGLLLGTRGGLPGPVALLAFTLIPYVSALAFTAALIAWDRVTVAGAKKAWHRKPWSGDLETGAIEGWGRAFEHRVDPRVATPGSSDAVRLPSAARWGLYLGGAGALAVVLLVAGVMFFSSVVTMIAVPAIGSNTVRRIAETEPLRRYVLPADDAIDPQEAGELLHALLAVGADREMPEALREPVHTYPDPWLPAGSRQGEGRDPLHPDFRHDLLERASGGLPAEEVAFLRGIVGHPAASDLARLARSSRIDVQYGRLRDPLPAGTRLYEFPIPSYQGLTRQGVAHHLLSAALLAHEGRPDEAEARIREVVSVGILLADQGPLLIDNLVGTTIARLGGDAMEAFLRGTGRRGEADDLRWAREAASRAAARASRRTRLGVTQGLREMRAAVTDSLAPPGLRWEMFMGLNAVAPCVNLARIVFGPGPEHENWVESAREALVRWPSDEPIFDMARYGYYGSTTAPGPPPLPLRPVIWLMGGSERPGGCGASIARLAD